MGSHRRTLAFALLAMAAVLVAGALAAYLRGGSDGGRVVLNRLRGHVVAMGWLTLAAKVYVHQGGRPGGRRWAVGSFNGDVTGNDLREAVWTAPDRIRLTTSGGAVHEVTVAAAGRPDRTVSAGW
ncbi:hypothetical protein ACIBTP_21920 [Streptomyces avidinii]|uniref:hypothetical protein n=1 Tax=Streptomyces avidinii TaxID=1895 RepID=UPI0037ADD366